MERPALLPMRTGGADVFIGNRKEDEGKSTVAEIESMGRRAAFKRTDVAVNKMY